MSLISIGAMRLLKCVFDELPTLYWFPKLHKRPYKSRFITISSSFTTIELCILLTFCLTSIKIMLLDIVHQCMSGIVKIYFGLLKFRCYS